jgi:outer membrane usher protein
MVALSLLLGLGTTAVCAQSATTKEAEEAFFELRLPLYVNEEYSGQYDIRLKPDTAETRVLFSRESVDDVLGIKAIPEVLDRLKDVYHISDWIDAAILRAVGLGVALDEPNLVVYITVPLELTRVTEIRLRPSLTAGAAKPVHPAMFSGILNFRGAVDTVYSGESFQLPYSFVADLGLNLYGWVLEGGLSLGTTGSSDSFYIKPNTINLIKDFEAPRLRLYVGDLVYPIQGFQGYQPMQGVSVSKELRLDRAAVRSSPGSIELLIQTPSKVELMLNGIAARTLRLQPGPYSIHDIALVSGINDLQVAVTDNFGNTEVLPYTLPFDNRLLGMGEHYFSYTLGIPTYVLDYPKLTGFHSFGFTKRFTAGANLQVAAQQQLIGLNAILATKIGSFGGDLAMSNVVDTGTGVAAFLQYRYLNANNAKSPVFSLSGRFTGKRFGNLSTPFPSAAAVVSFAGSAGISPGLGLNLSAAGRLRINETSSEPSIVVTAAKALGDVFSVRTNFGFDFPRDSEMEWRGHVSFSSRQESANLSVTARHDIQSGASALTWSKNSDRPVGGINSNGGFQGNPVSAASDQHLYAGMNYPGYRFSADVSTSIRRLPPDEYEPEMQSRTSLRAASALVYADRRIGLSAPVNDSFAMVAPNDRLQNQFLGVNSVSNTYTAKTDILGAPVLSSIGSYTSKQIHVESPELPLGLDLGTTSFTLLPTYRSGTVIPMGTEASVFVQGILVSPDGEGISLQVGEVISLTEPQSEPILFFTDEGGIFMIFGLKPGIYRLRLFVAPEVDLDFEIDEGAEGLWDLKNLELPLQLASEGHR